MTPSPKAVVGVDVGGTFTDLFWFDEAEKRFRTAKVPSQRGDEAKGFIAGLTTFGPVSGLASIVHGTTVGTNALLERKGAKVGVITTPGFRDALEMRRRDRRQTWGLWGDFTPAASRENRLEVPERTLADGTIRTAVDLDAVREAARRLAEQGCEALAIIFINAYANPANERAALEAARTVWPNEHLACSSAILPEIREFERASTTALNATLQPLVGSYLGRLEDALAEDGFTGRFHIVQSNGGVMSTATARKLPVRTALSGPAAGVIAAAAIARAAGFPDVITGDLGGTSFDVSLIAGGEAALAAQSTIDFGMVIRTPMIEITTIGAGGGSIARVDAGGLLEVGPESAGSRPGPVCYGGGNDRPTLTDANLVLGRIDGSKPLGTLQSLNIEAAREAIRLKIAEPLGLDVMTAAEAIVKIANARMAGAIRLVSIERGHDPAKFLAMPFGGGGALHAGALIKEVGLRGALVPRFPGVTSALGCVIADIRHDGVQTVNLMLDGLDAAALDARMVEAGTEAHAIVADAGLSVTSIDVLYELDMHYLGQTHTVAVPLPVTLRDSPPPRGEGPGVGGEKPEPILTTNSALAAASDSKPLTQSSAPHPNPSPPGGGAPAPLATTGVTSAIIREAFDRAYGAAFSRLLPGIPVRIVTLRTAAIGRRPAFDLTALAPAEGATLEAARRGSRQVYIEGQWRETAIWSRLDLPVGARIEGPAMLEQSDATILLDPGLTAEVDALGNLVILRS